MAGEVSSHCLANDLPILLLLSLPQKLVSVGRIELPSHGPKPRILPLNYTEKIWWTDGGSNPDFRLAKPMCSHYHYQPSLLENTLANPFLSYAFALRTLVITYFLGLEIQLWNADPIRPD